MPQTDKKKTGWGERPSSKKAAARPARAELDKFVRGGETAKGKRLNVEISAALHTRVKAGCAQECREIRDVVTELLEQRFPVSK